MREIKFKFYDREEKRLVALADVFDTALYPMLVRESLVPCQYTGLKDKNGKEIYEGDIVKDGSDVQEIIFESGCFVPSKSTPDINYQLERDFEIIGNIYESPNLLTNK